jgi:hypothetical protein
MVAARGAGGDVVPLKQDAVDAAQCAIAHDAGAGGATPMMTTCVVILFILARLISSR